MTQIKGGNEVLKRSLSAVLALLLALSVLTGLTISAQGEPYQPRNAALASGGASASTSSSHPPDSNPLSFQPVNTIDGVRNTGLFWNDNTANTYPDWVEITFPRREIIDTINVFTVGDDVGASMPDLNTTFTLYGIRNFELQYDDGGSWVTIPGTQTENNNHVWNQFTFEPVTTTKIRLMITGGGDFSRVSEIEAFTCAPSPDGEPEPPAKDAAFDDAQWMWQSAAGPANTWMCFKKTFSLDQLPESAVASIAVDSKYYLWVNGQLAVFEGGLNRGPEAGKGYYDAVDIASYLKKGENDIAVLVWYWGNQGRNNVDSGGGGLLFSADLDGERVNSDASWKMQLHPAYGGTTGEQPAYLYGGYNIGFDARKDFAEDWTQPGFDTSDWGAPVLKGTVGSQPWGQLEKRPIPQWKYSGILSYTNEILRDGDKVVMNLPYGAQVTPYFKVNAPAGTVIDVRSDRYATTGGPGDGHNLYRGHRTEYTTKEGVQEFEALDWMFAEQIIYTIPEDVEILELGYRESGCDVELVPVIETDDSFYNTLAQKAQRTLYACMRDNFMDCPDRERGQWIGDVSSQAPQVFYALDSSGAVFLRKSIDNFIRNRKGDVIVGNVPGVHWDELPSQSLNAISTEGTVMQYYQFTGDSSIFELTYEPVRNYLKLWTFNEDGSLINRHGGWEWYDHGSGIDNAVNGTCWYYMALKAAVEMAQMTGHEEDIPWFTEKMEGISNTFETLFWKGDGYRSGSLNDDRANALAVLSGLADPAHYPQISEVLRNVQQATPYMEGYVLESLFVMGYPEQAMERMKQRYAVLVESENSTLWEDFSGVGTKNHAWSGGPLTLLNKYVAGVYPTTPGYDTYRVTPNLCGLHSVCVEVPSVKGTIGLEISASDDSLTMQLTSPEDTVAQVAVPRFGTRNTRVMINGETAFEDGVGTVASYRGNDEQYIYFDLVPGSYTIAADVKAEQKESYTLRVDASEGGGILVNGQEVELPYSAAFAAGEQVELRAVPNEDKQFAGFTGSFVSSSDTLTLTMEADYTFVASFEDLDWEQLKKPLQQEVSACAALQQNKFTPFSWDKLQAALQSANEVLQMDQPTRAEVEQALEALRSARQALATAKDVNLALNTQVTASSVAGAPQFYPDKLVDGIVAGAPSTSNCWSSDASTAIDHTEWVQIDLGSEMRFDEFLIYPRIEGAATGYGFPKDFFIAVSADGENWTTVVEETQYPYVGETPQTFSFDQVSARYIRFTGTSLNSNPGDNNSYRMQIAEFEVFRRTDVDLKPADKTILNKVIARAQELRTGEEYANAIELVQQSFDAALAKAVEVSGDPAATEADVNAAWVALMTEIHKLGIQMGDKQALAECYEFYSALDLSEYVDGPEKDAFVAALSHAEQVLEDRNAVQSEVDAAQAALVEAADALVKLADKSMLQKVVDQVSDYRQQDFAKGWADFEAALTEAQTILAQQDATQKQVDDALSRLIDGMLGLRYRADKKLLTTLIHAAEAIDLDGYTSASVEAFERALNEARAVLENGALSTDEQEVVDRAVSDLTEAVEGLVSESDMSRFLTVGQDGTIQTSGGSAKTGETLPAACAVVLLLAAGLCVSSRRKKK